MGSAWPLLAGYAFTLASGLVTAWLVRDYYRTHLPHFDSIGTFTLGWETMNAAVSGGPLAGLAFATSISLTWLEPLYALLWAWLPLRSPALLITLNFVLVAISQYAIWEWCRIHGYGWRQQLILLILPFVPGAFHTWDGGLQDWRRDIQTNVLMIGVLFMALAYVSAPSRRRALALGIIAGLMQWSRDNALTMIALAAFPALVLAVVDAGRQQRWRELPRIGWLPLLVFLLFAVPYYALTLAATIFRYTFIVWGTGENRLASLAGFWTSPVSVLLGGTAAYNGKPAVGEATAVLLLACAVAVVGAIVGGLLSFQPARLRQRRSLILIGSGLFVVVGVILYNTLGLGYGAQYHGMPFVPVATGLIALAAGLGDALVPRETPRARRAVGTLAIVVVVGLLPLNVYRVQAARFESLGTESVGAANQAAFTISELVDRNTVISAFWLSGFSTYHINYYITQAGHPRVQKLDDHDHRYAIDGPMRTGESPEAWLELLRTGTKERASVILVNTDLTRYANPEAPPGVFRFGQGMIRSLLEDPDLIVVDYVQIGPNRLAILSNPRAH